VEEGAPDDQKEDLLARWAQRLGADGVDAVVLGCTHYLHLADDLGRHLGPGVAIVDSRDGVGRRVAALLEEYGILAATRDGPDLFHFTAQGTWGPEVLGPLEARYRSWSSRFDLEYAGPWVLTGDRR